MMISTYPRSWDNIRSDLYSQRTPLFDADYSEGLFYVADKKLGDDFSYIHWDAVTSIKVP